MGSMPWILLGVAALLILLLAVVFLLKKKHKPDYYTFFIMGILWLAIGIFFRDYFFILMGIVFAVLGLLHKKEWKKNHRTWDKFGEKEKRIKLVLTGVLLLLVLAGIAAFFLYSR